MPLHINIRKSIFWVNVFKIALPFFIVVALISIFFDTGRYIFTGRFTVITEYYFGSNRWLRFLLQKGVISVMYGMYMANKNMK